jgi:hypothetical protein
MYVSVCEGRRGWLGCLDRADSSDGMDAVDELRVCLGTGPSASAVVDADREACPDAEEEAVADAKADADGESGGRDRMKSLDDVFRWWMGRTGEACGRADASADDVRR